MRVGLVITLFMDKATSLGYFPDAKLATEECLFVWSKGAVCSKFIKLNQRETKYYVEHPTVLITRDGTSLIFFHIPAKF